MSATEANPPKRRRKVWPRRHHIEPIVFHAIGLKLALELGDQTRARTEADALLDALAFADALIPMLVPPRELIL